VLRMIAATAAGTSLYFPMDAPPPSFRYLFTHRGRLIGFGSTANRALYYSEPGFPESWPENNFFANFPMQEHDDLVAGGSVGDVMVLACQDVIITMLDVPAWIDGQFRATQATALRGAPGCVGAQAFTTYSVSGEARAAWVSSFGVYVTDGHTVRRISDDMDWTADTWVANLSTAVLHWDKKRQSLLLFVDSDGDGVNDIWWQFHMLPEHQKWNGMPKIGGPNYGDVACVASGNVAGTYRVWSGHFSNGIVYLEDDGTTDTSQAYSGTQVPFNPITPRMYGEFVSDRMVWRDWATYKAMLRHTSAGSGTITVDWTTGRDASGVTQSVTKTPSLVGQDADEFYVGLGGQWAEVELTHTGAANFALLDLTAEVQAMGRSGRVA